MERFIFKDCAACFISHILATPISWQLLIGELAVQEEFPEAVIFRPSDIYGSEDRFMTYYAAFWRRQGSGMPLWKKGEKTVKQPVFVSDLAQGILNAARNFDTNGQVYQAIG